MKRHPSFRRLSGFADGSLGKFEKSRVRSHLAGCESCRAKVQFIRRLRETAPNTLHPNPPPDLLEDILRRRENGDRTFLPLTPPARPTRSPLFVSIAAALIAVAGVVVLLLPSASVRATSSELRFSAEIPLPGQAVDVEYVAASAFGSPEVLRLRGKYREADDGPIRDSLGRDFELLLTPNSDGVYTGTVTLPQEAVYAVFVVEDTAATYVDSNGRRFWELLSRGNDGSPSLDGMLHKYKVRASRDWEGAMGVASELTRLYPESALGWSLLLAHELQIRPEAEREQLLQESEARFLDLSAKAPQSVNELESLVLWARMLGDDTSLEGLVTLLSDTDPDNRVVVQERVRRAIRESYDRPADLLSQLEDEWDRSEAGDAFVAQVGLQTAQRLSDSESVRTWALRNLQSHGSAKRRAIIAMASHPDLVAEAVSLATAITEAGGADEARALGMTRQASRLQRIDTLGALHLQLGMALIEVGDLETGRTMLQRASGDRWEPAAYRALAEMDLAAGDTASAAQLLSWLAVDPTVEGQRNWADSVAISLRIARPDWDALLNEARDQLLRVIRRDEPSPRPIGSEATVSRGDGTHTPMEDILREHVTIVVFLSNSSGPALQLLPHLGDFAIQARQHGAHVAAVMAQAPSPELDALLAQYALPFPVLHDPERQAFDAFWVTGTPLIAVTDQLARIRFEPADLDAALRYALYLSADDLVASGPLPRASESQRTRRREPRPQSIDDRSVRLLVRSSAVTSPIEWRQQWHAALPYSGSYAWQLYSH